MNTPYDHQVTARAKYEPDLQDNDPACCAKEENWVAITSNQSHKRVIERGANDYLLRLVDPTWISPLKTKRPSSPGWQRSRCFPS